MLVTTIIIQYTYYRFALGEWKNDQFLIFNYRLKLSKNTYLIKS